MSKNPQPPSPSAGQASLSGFSRLNIRAKLLLSIVTLGLVAIVATAGVSYYLSREALQQEAFAKLTAVGKAKADSIESYYQNIRYELSSTADSLTVRNALRELSSARRVLLDELAKAGAPVDAATEATIRRDVSTYYQNVLLANLAKVRSSGIGDVKDYVQPDLEANVLQFVYTVKNPAVVGSKSDNNELESIRTNPALDARFREAFVKTSFARAHAAYHPWLTEVRTRYGYYDIFVCDADGNVVYTNFKELDFNGNLRTGPEKGTGLGEAYAAAWAADRDKTLDGHVRLTDFKPYPKSYDAPAAFISAPIFGADGRKEGVFIYQMPVDRINAVMTSHGKQEEFGLGKSGESYLVGPDFIQRTDSRFMAGLSAEQKRKTVASDGQALSETTIGVLPVKTTGAEKALSKGSEAVGAAVYPDYRGTPVVGYYAPLNVKGLNYAILSEIDASEAFAPAQKQAIASSVVAFFALLLFIGSGIWLANGFTQPIVALARTSERLAAGDLTARANLARQDELGTLATGFNRMVESLAATQTRLSEENKALQANIRDLLGVVSDASDGNLSVRAKVTEGALGNVADALNLMFDNIGELLGKVRQVASQVGSAASQIQGSADTLAQGAERQSNEIVNTTSAVQEMSANIEAVSNNATTAAEAARRAKEASEDGNRSVSEVINGMEKLREDVQALAKKIKRLGERSMEISTITNTIAEISNQTNILALNAAIEAARAGEQGRGFAVVAEEVRKLAERTAGSTREIEKLIGSIQAETNEAVASMEAQTHAVEQESRIVSAAGEALGRIREVSLQSAELINEINLSGKQQVRGAAGVAQAMEIVAQVADQARNGAQQTKQSTQGLTELAEELNRSVAQFKLAA